MLEQPCVVCATPTQFHAVQGGELIVIPFPEPPYEWVEAGTEQLADIEEVYVIGVGKKLVGKRQYQRIPTEAVTGTRAERTKIDFIHQVILDYPDYFASYSNRKDPYPVFLDIETTSSEHFSNPERDEIISAQVKYRDENPIILEVTSQYSEAQLIEDLLKLLSKSPKTGKFSDFIVGFYLNKFDLPFIYKRAYKHKIAPLVESIGRHREIGVPSDSYYYPSVLQPRKAVGETSTAITVGIYGMDLSMQARADVTIAHLPRKGLKQIVAHYGFQPFDIPEWGKRNMGEFRAKYPDQFMRYMISDIEATEYLYNVYEPSLIAAANMLKAPLINVQRASHGLKSTIAAYREGRKHKFFGLYPNTERYAPIYQRAQKYQGALVGCMRRGYFDQTVYVDCKSMYPNIMHDFNISPDSYRFEDIVDYTGDENSEILFGDITMKEIIVENIEGGKKRIYIPDDNYQGYLIYTCDFENDGYIRRLISELNSKRDSFKSEAKRYYKEFLNSGKTDKDAYSKFLMFNSYQNEAKIINNTLYGIQGDRSSKVGDLPAAVFVTAIGRWIMASMIRLFKDAVLEVDTDGLLLDKTKVTMSIDEVNKHLRDLIHNKFGIPYERMRFMLEFEGEGSVYLYKSKNYLLRKNEDNSLTIKGSAFKGYDKANVIKDVVKIVADAIMFKTMSYEDAVSMATALREKPLEDFKFTKQIRQLPSAYKDFNDMFVVLYGFSRDGMSKREVLAEMKSRMIKWVSSAVPSEKRRVEINKSIRGAKSEEELVAIGSMFTQSKSKKDRNKLPVMLQISLDMLERGRTVEIDDVFEYYWTLTPKRYTLAEDMNENVMLDYERYMREISRILERFKYADPSYSNTLLFDDSNEIEFYIDSSGGSPGEDNTEEEEDEKDELSSED